MIDFYTAPAPNGYKVAIMLEECGLAYHPHILDLNALDQKQPAFLRINPNGRIPAIVDREMDDFAVFESGAILIYLAEKTGMFLPQDARGRSTVIQWLMFQMGGVGPMMGQLSVFRNYFPERLPSAITRYEREVRRLFGVLEGRLTGRAFIAEDYSIADMALWSFVRGHAFSGLTLDDFPALAAWLERVRARPGVQRGMAVAAPLARAVALDGIHRQLA